MHKYLLFQYFLLLSQFRNLRLPLFPTLVCIRWCLRLRLDSLFIWQARTGSKLGKGNSSYCLWCSLHACNKMCPSWINLKIGILSNAQSLMHGFHQHIYNDNIYKIYKIFELKLINLHLICSQLIGLGFTKKSHFLLATNLPVRLPIKYEASSRHFCISLKSLAFVCLICFSTHTWQSHWYC